MRPITVMPILQRLYSAIRLRQTIFRWQEAVIERCGDRAQGVAGGRQGASTKDLVYAASMMLERAVWEEDTITGVSYDLSKAFDTLPVQMGEQGTYGPQGLNEEGFLWRVLERLGFPGLMHNLYRDFYAQFTARFKMNAFWGNHSSGDISGARRRVTPSRWSS